ncbi:hypothetical protein TrRE_jg249, partial [Triparma retinervis]
GSEGLQNEQVRDAFLKLASKEKPVVAYLGTATYDLPQFKSNQTRLLAEVGCPVLDVVCSNPGDTTMGDAKEKIGRADVIIVSGGNTLFAVDRWKKLGLDEVLREAAERGAVIGGGSAGAICWFDAGHSDSFDPDSYKGAMLREFGNYPPTKKEDESSDFAGGEAAQWKYIRVPCLGFLPGLVCPHADKVQSNGVLRIVDFEEMLRRHPGETGICIDHYAGIVLDGDEFNILSMEGKPGTVMEDGTCDTERKGRPGCWVKRVKGDGSIETRLVPGKGRVQDWFEQAREINEDPACDSCRKENPTESEF